MYASFSVREHATCAATAAQSAIRNRLCLKLPKFYLNDGDFHVVGPAVTVCVRVRVVLVLSNNLMQVSPLSCEVHVAVETLFTFSVSYIIHGTSRWHYSKLLPSEIHNQAEDAKAHTLVQEPAASSTGAHAHPSIFYTYARKANSKRIKIFQQFCYYTTCMGMRMITLSAKTHPVSAWAPGFTTNNSQQESP